MCTAGLCSFFAVSFHVDGLDVVLREAVSVDAFDRDSVRLLPLLHGFCRTAGVSSSVLGGRVSVNHYYSAKRESKVSK